MKKGLDKNRVKGMLFGAFLGDALGAPHEFACNRDVIYTGKLEHQAFYDSRFQGRKILQVGQITDDSEMTITLFRAIIRDNGYNRDSVIQDYMKWANSGLWMMGTNTRKLLKGIKTLKGYQKRIDKILELPISERSQSNGCLMRCCPLALIWNNECVVQDVSITNPHPVNIDCCLVYISSIRLALLGKSNVEIFDKVKLLARTSEVREVLNQVENKKARDIRDKKGWCLHGLWCALMGLMYFESYSKLVEWIITSQPGSDTDTNACIAGALFGAYTGYENLDLEQSSNISILINCDTENGPTPRQPEYTVRDVLALI